MSTPVTVEVTRRTAPHRADDAVTWLDDGLRLARRFPGCLGGGIVRDDDDSGVLHVAYRFSDEQRLRAWECSAERRRWLLDGAPFVLDASVQRRTGVEGWFDAPQLRREVHARTGSVRTVKVRSAPVRWKQAVAIWCGMFPLNVLVNVVVSQLAWFQALPLVLRSALLVSTLVPLMTFIMMPAVTSVLQPWLRRNPGVIRTERSLLSALDDLAEPPRPAPGLPERGSGPITPPMP